MCMWICIMWIYRRPDMFIVGIKCSILTRKCIIHRKDQLLQNLGVLHSSVGAGRSIRGKNNLLRLMLELVESGMGANSHLSEPATS